MGQRVNIHYALKFSVKKCQPVYSLFSAFPARRLRMSAGQLKMKRVVHELWVGSVCLGGVHGDGGMAGAGRGVALGWQGVGRQSGAAPALRALYLRLAGRPPRCSVSQPGLQVRCVLPTATVALPCPGGLPRRRRSPGRPRPFHRVSATSASSPHPRLRFFPHFGFSPLIRKL